MTDRIVPAAQKAAPTAPIPEDTTTLVRVNAVVQLVGAAALATGRFPRLSSTVLAASLVPTTIAGHPFWAESDPAAARAQRLQFVKNVSTLGGLLLAGVDTEGRPGVRVARPPCREGRASRGQAPRPRRAERRQAGRGEGDLSVVPAADPSAADWPAPVAEGRVDAAVRLPGSKSLTNRALLLAGVADGPSVVRRALRSRDHRADGRRAARPGPRRRLRRRRLGGAAGGAGAAPARDAVDCGLAGTVMRFVPPVAALASGRVGFDGDPHMRTRPIGTLLDALRDLGVALEGGPTLPFVVADAARCRAVGSCSTRRRRRSSSRRCCWRARRTTRGSTWSTRARRCPRCRTSR